LVSGILEIRHLYHHIYSEENLVFVGLTLLIAAYAPSIRLLLLL
jgi:hypothetical protein